MKNSQNKRVAVYIRVSSQEQVMEGYSILAQKERLSSYCEAHNWLVADFYIDGGYTGANLKRPGIQKLIAEINKFDIVLVYKLDRFSRSQRDAIYLIEEVLLPNNVDFVSVCESFDTSVSFGRAMIGILSVFAQLEREQIKERTMMGRIERAKKGLFHCAASPIGYDYANGKLVINEYEAEQVRKIYDWYLNGTSPGKIAKRLRAEGYTNRYGSWKTAESVRSVLINEVYLGKIRFSDVVAENAHEPLISQEIFEKAKTIKIKRQKLFSAAPYKAKNLLASMMFCGQCGARYFLKHNYGPYKRYSCYSRAKNCRQMAKAENCNNKHWKPEELEKIVNLEVERLLLNPFSKSKKPKEKISKDLKDLIANASEIWESADTEEKRRILQTIISRITLDGDNVKIEWTFL